MLRAVVVDVAALAESHEVTVEVVGGVVIAVCRGQHDPRRTDDAEILDGWEALQRTALPIAPGANAGVPPAPITEMVDGLPVRPAAALTSTACPPEADRGRELRPIDRVEEAVLPADRHRSINPQPKLSANELDRDTKRVG